MARSLPVAANQQAAKASMRAGARPSSSGESSRVRGSVETVSSTGPGLRGGKGSQRMLSGSTGGFNAKAKRGCVFRVLLSGVRCKEPLGLATKPRRRGSGYATRPRAAVMVPGPGVWRALPVPPRQSAGRPCADDRPTAVSGVVWGTWHRVGSRGRSPTRASSRVPRWSSATCATDASTTQSSSRSTVGSRKASTRPSSRCSHRYECSLRSPSQSPRSHRRERTLVRRSTFTLAVSV